MANQWISQGVAAVAANDLPAARDCFVAAVKVHGAVARHHYLLACILERLNDPCGAAEHLTIALRLEPSMTRAAERLCGLFSQGVLSRPPRLDPAGIEAALQFHTIDRDLIVAAVWHHATAERPLNRILKAGQMQGWDRAAHKCIFEGTPGIANEQLVVTCLEAGLIARADLESLFTAIRKALLIELPRDRLRNPRLFRFAVALMRQCWLNEFVWSETDEEVAELSKMSFDGDAVTVGNVEACRMLLLKCMYLHPQEVLGFAFEASRLSSDVPEPLRQSLVESFRETYEVRIRGISMPRLGRVSSDTSLRVANQYERDPYPRWTGVQLFEPGQYLDHIRHHFKDGQRDFLRQRFEVLIAGCGTGRQAISAAFDYGENARILGFDISRNSLGYASLMAERLRAPNLSLAYGDIENVLAFEPSFASRFHIIECGGVLHHMTDPFAAWAKLLKCLAPSGIMLIGLYSKTARRRLRVLREEPGYPGHGIDRRGLSLFYSP